MGLGRLAHGNRKPARGIDFSIDRLQKDLRLIKQQQQSRKTIYKEPVAVVQSVESENDCS